MDFLVPANGRAEGGHSPFLQGKDGPLVKGTGVAISNVRKGTSDNREEEATSIMWTFWGKLAENAAEYLGKGSRVNIVGRVQNNNYEKAPGEVFYGLTFTCEEIDYLDSKADVEARRERMSTGPASQELGAAAAPDRGSDRHPGGKPGGTATPDDDIPF